MTWHKIGYRTRWAYLLPVGFGWLLWYTLFLEKTLQWRVRRPARLRWLDHVWIYWSGGDARPQVGWDMTSVFDRHPTTNYLNNAIVFPPTIHWWTVGLPVALAAAALLPVLLLRCDSARRERWARWATDLAAGLMASLLVTAAVHHLLITDRLEWIVRIIAGRQTRHDELLGLVEAWYNPPPTTPISVVGQQIQGLYRGLDPDLVRAGAVVALLLFWIPCTRLIRRRDQHQSAGRHIERLTRWMALLALAAWIGHVVVAPGYHQRNPILATATFACLTALLWAVTCRSALLLRFEYLPADAPHCPACGYDLRGSPGGAEARCPECGAPAARDAPG